MLAKFLIVKITLYINSYFQRYLLFGRKYSSVYLEPLGDKVKLFKPVVLNLGEFAPRGLLVVPRDIFGCHNQCATGIYWVEAREAAPHATMHIV